MNTPLAALFFEILRLFPYNFALFLITAIYLVPIFIMFRHATRNLSSLEFSVSLVFLGFLSIGNLVALDRSNYAILIGPILYYVFIFYSQGRVARSYTLLVLLAAIKFWGVIFLLFFSIVYFKKHNSKIYWAWLGVVASYLLPMSLLPGALHKEINVMFDAVFNRDYGSFVSKFSVSTYGLALKMNCLRLGENCNPSDLARNFPGANYASIAIAIFHFLIAVWIYYLWKEQPVLWSIPVISFVFLLVPEAAMYNLGCISAIAAMLLRANHDRRLSLATDLAQTSGNPVAFGESTRLRQRAITSISLAVAITSLPIAFLGELLDSKLGDLRLSTVFSPVIWNLVILIVLHSGIRNKRLVRK
jgi:hypothetical protein